MKPTGILEAVLYADDLAAAERFYAEVFGLPVVVREEGRQVFFQVGTSMLLIFNPQASESGGSEVNGAPIPPHGARGPGHVAFSVPLSEIGAWKAHFAKHNVAIDSEVHWPHGGRSLYVRDPANNSVEVAAPEIWGMES